MMSMWRVRTGVVLLAAALSGATACGGLEEDGGALHAGAADALDQGFGPADELGADPGVLDEEVSAAALVLALAAPLLAEPPPETGSRPRDPPLSLTGVSGTSPDPIPARPGEIRPTSVSFPECDCFNELEAMLCHLLFSLTAGR